MAPLTGAPLAVRFLFGDPVACASTILASGRNYGLVELTVTHHDEDRIDFELTLEPWVACASENYPTERVRISVTADGTVAAVPLDATPRRWKHRNATGTGKDRRWLDLCLWYPRDPRVLLWDWSDGLSGYITVVHRHLQAEECWRRSPRGEWPGEDAPHGDTDGDPHPIRTAALWSLVEKAP